MSSLTNTVPATNYKDLLQVSYSNSGITATLRDLSDGEGTASKLQLSTTAVNINAVGALQISGGTVGATAAEFNVLSGVTAGTALASKAVVLDSNKQIDEIDIKTTFQLNNVTVSSTAAELNYNDVTTIGTTQASKAVVLSANKGQDVLTLANAASAASTIATDHSVITAVDDGSNVHVMATKDDAGTETTIKLAEQSSITNLSAAGAFYFGDGTDDYITIADNANLRFGTGNFGLIFKNIRLIDYTPSAAVTIARKANAGAENLGWIFTLETDGKPQIAFGNATNFTTLVYKSATAIDATNGTTIHLAAIVTRETASVAGSVKFYQFGYDTWKLLSSVAITAGTPQTVTETTPSALLLFQNIDGATEYAFQSLGGFIPCNFAPTYAEVKEFIEKGIPAKYQWGSQTDMMSSYNGNMDTDITGWNATNGSFSVSSVAGGVSGNCARIQCTSTSGSFHRRTTTYPTLTVGKTYRIQFYLKGDLSAAGNIRYYWNNTSTVVTAGINYTDWTLVEKEFVLTGTPSKFLLWLENVGTYDFYVDNISLTQIGAVLAMLPQNMTASTVYDASSNNLDGSVVGATLLNAKVADAFVNPNKAAIDDDVIATVKHSGYDSAGNLDDFVKIETIMQDVTATTEDGGYKISAMGAGALKNMVEIDNNAGTFVINEDGIDSDFRIEGVGAANALFVRGSDGNVGIGTTSPGDRLEVANSATVVGLILNRNQPLGNTPEGGVGSILFSGQNASGAARNYARILSDVDENSDISGRLQFSTLKSGTLTEQVRIDNQGNLGIGTTTPNYLLSVNGTCQITGATSTLSTLAVAGKITATSGLTISNKVDTNQSLIWHISPWDFVDNTSYDSTSGFCYTTNTGLTMSAPFRIPYQLFGGTVVIDQLTLYGYTAVAGNDTLTVYLRKTDQDGTITAIDDTGALTGGGNFNGTMFAGDYTMLDYAYWLEADPSYTSTGANSIRIYDIKIEAHLE